MKILFCAVMSVVLIAFSPIYGDDSGGPDSGGPDSGGLGSDDGGGNGTCNQSIALPNGTALPAITNVPFPMRWPCAEYYCKNGTFCVHKYENYSTLTKS